MRWSLQTANFIQTLSQCSTNPKHSTWLTPVFPMFFLLIYFYFFPTDPGTGRISQKGHLTPLSVSFLGLCSFSPSAEWSLQLSHCCHNRSLSKQLLLLICFPSLTLLLEENKTSHRLPDPWRTVQQSSLEWSHGGGCPLSAPRLAGREGGSIPRECQHTLPCSLTTLRASAPGSLLEEDTQFQWPQTHMVWATQMLSSLYPSSRQNFCCIFFQATLASRRLSCPSVYLQCHMAEDTLHTFLFLW